MKYTKFKGNYPSADGVHSISYSVFFPIGEVKGVIQVSHGMCEYFDRYTGFAEYMTGLGFAVCGNDHLGHGSSVNDESEYGWFSEENGWQNAVEDIYSLTKIMKKNYPDLPYFLFGHSMGSFLARAYVIRHGKNLDGAVFCGTSGGIDGTSGLLAFVDMLKKAHGDKHRSKLVDKMAFGTYNSRISEKYSRYDWLSRDKEVVDKYASDKRCTFIFTLNGFENLMKVLWYVSNEKWFEAYPKELPTYLTAGSADPVGNYGKGVLKVYNRLREYGCNVDMKIYDGARHELLNETNREEVFADVAGFIQAVINGKNTAECELQNESDDN